MFESARLKLTLWYLLIIMIVSISFSVVIYHMLTSDLERAGKIQKLHIANEPVFVMQNIPVEGYPAMPDVFITNYEKVLTHTKARLQLTLVFINIGVLGAASLAGFFLAGRTLKPIQQMIDEQNRFITDASHELRTPITSLKTELEVNLRDKTVSQETKKILRSNIEEVNSLQTLSDNLIKSTQYQKTPTSAFEKVSLHELVNEVYKKVASLARHKSISLHNKVQKQEIVANRQTLSEAFVILLDNAIKYSPKNTSVVISSTPGKQFVTIAIKDEGVGIDREVVPHIFDRFYRADASRTKRTVEGFGLGLAIAKQIIEKHHGIISVTSEVGKGSTFLLQLPRKHRA